LLAFFLSAVWSRAGQNLCTDDPTEFFTNIASRLLTSELNLDLARIQIYPTSQYTPAVHRLLQITLNLYDSTTNNLYPTVFRPYFTSDGTNIFISGYELVNGPDTLPTSPTFLTIPTDLNDPEARASIGATPTHLNVYGVPWIIGARKGFPNLNEIVMQSTAQITRKLLIRKPYIITTDFTQFQTAQMFLIGISNVLGVEVWNSYSNNYPRAVYIQADGTLSMTLTNDLGYNLSLSYPIGGAITGATNVPADTWQGTGWQPGVLASPNPQSFLVPLLTNVVFLPDSAYQVNPLPGQFIPVTTNIAQNWPLNPPGSFPQPLWGLNITNRIRCMIIDEGVAGGRVIDYVQLNGLNSYRDLAAEIYSRDPSFTNFWITNLVSSIFGLMPLGLNNQIMISMGQPDLGDVFWLDNMISAPIGPTREWAIDDFRTFLGLQPIWNPYLQNTQLVIQVPFTPTSKTFQVLTWQANDPLVHYTLGNLSYSGLTNLYSVVPPNASLPAAALSLWRYTDRYDPWGGNPAIGPVGDKNAYLTSLKDPMVRSSDEWDFPSGEPLSFGTLGRIHRGTPWQTVYLKASDIALSTWINWTGDSVNWIPAEGIGDVPDAAFSRPVMDRDLIDLLGSMLSTNNPGRRLSINNSDINAWLAVLNGMPVQTNSSPVATLIVSSNSLQALLIAQGINDARFNLFTNHIFLHLGDILATPQLSEQSPFLNTAQLQTLSAGGLSDEMMECIPSQLLPLLREDSWGLMTWFNTQLRVQFTGYDGYAYAIQASSNLKDWRDVGTYCPANGVFSFPVSAPPGIRRQFYRSVLLHRTMDCFHPSPAVFTGGRGANRSDR
jgi:hypothetical protein